MKKYIYKDNKITIIIILYYITIIFTIIKVRTYYNHIYAIISLLLIKEKYVFYLVYLLLQLV